MVNLGKHLAARLVEVGVTHCFGVPGDFNLLLLDQLITNPDLKMVWCCNELNAGYAADGYARSKGVGACVVTFCVGGFSVINAIAGAYSEDLPVIVISGGPNTNDYATNHTLHHTTGLPDFDQQYRCFREVTCAQVKIQHIEDAHGQIDYAISQALLHSKPAYVEISCNLADLTHPSFVSVPVRYHLPQRHTNPNSLRAAVDATVEVLKGSVKPVLLAGPRLRTGGRKDAFRMVADASKYAVAVLPDAKGFFPESHPGFIGTYWGAVSSPCCCETVEAADIVITAGTVWTDYTTVGYSLLLKRNKVIRVEADRVTILDGKTFGCIAMQDFLEALAKEIPPNDSAVVNFKRMYVPLALPEAQPDGEELKTIVLMKHVQDMLTPDTALISEVGDSWFNSQKMRLPDGCTYELQLRYGSIGWSVGAVLGYSMASTPQKRVLALIGDGSFQMTAQEVSTMMRFGANPIILLINNGGYTIEVEIHDGPYNQIKNWNYTAFVEAMHNGEGKVWTSKVRTEKELVQALHTAREHSDLLCFIEVMVHRDDCSRELLEWGSRVSAANSRPPNPQ